MTRRTRPSTDPPIETATTAGRCAGAGDDMAGDDMAGEGSDGAGLSRRALLGAGVAAPVALGATACSAPGGGEASQARHEVHEARRLPFAGAHQAAITATPVPKWAKVAAFTVVSTDRSGLAQMFAHLTDTISDLMAGRMPEDRDPAYPPLQTGILGPEMEPDDLGIVVSVGAGLFDDRYGLAPRKPRELVEMPFLANDRLDPNRSHGDILVTIEADHSDTILHSLRQIMRATRRHLVLNWTVDGYSRGVGPAGQQTPRNLLGFKDGTANLDLSDAELMDRHVWVGSGDGEPSWAVGGTYHVVRIIRMFVEFWDRTRLGEQEAIFGRHKATGAPLGQDDEFDPISYNKDPDGEVIPLDAHIRLANPRTPETQDDLMLRRGFSYSGGVDDRGLLDQGLAFVSYQRQLSRFLRVQERLDGEPLEEYILPVGGGFFFALPGARDERSSIAAGLLA